MNIPKGDILADKIERIIIAKLIVDGGAIASLTEALAEFRAEFRAPWTLGRSVNGFTLGEGQQWRWGWERDELPDGTRPLIEGEREQVGDHALVLGNWEQVELETPLNEMRVKRRTTRPLPAVAEKWAAEKQAFKEGKEIQIYIFDWLSVAKDAVVPWDGPYKFRVKPEPVMVPLGPEDVPPGSAHFRDANGYAWNLIIATTHSGIWTKQGFTSFIDMAIPANCHKIHRPGTITADGNPLFVRCEKESK